MVSLSYPGKNNYRMSKEQALNILNKKEYLNTHLKITPWVSSNYRTYIYSKYRITYIGKSYYDHFY